MRGRRASFESWPSFRTPCAGRLSVPGFFALFCQFWQELAEKEAGSLCAEASFSPKENLPASLYASLYTPPWVHPRYTLCTPPWVHPRYTLRYTTLGIPPEVHPEVYHSGICLLIHPEVYPPPWVYASLYTPGIPHHPGYMPPLYTRVYPPPWYMPPLYTPGYTHHGTPSSRAPLRRSAACRAAARHAPGLSLEIN